MPSCNREPLCPRCSYSPMRLVSISNAGPINTFACPVCHPIYLTYLNSEIQLDPLKSDHVRGWTESKGLSPPS